MNSDQDIKMFSKIVVHVANTTLTSVVDLTDSGGSMLPCDYIEIETINTTAGYYQVSPSSLGGANYAGVVAVSATTVAGGSGAPGWVGSNTSILRISLPWDTRTSRISISNVVSDTSFLVRYGISKKKNQTRDHAITRHRGS